VTPVGSAKPGNPEMHAGRIAFPLLERIVYGEPAAQALAAEAERLNAQRVFLVVSGTMNRTTDEIARVRAALGARCAGVYDRVRPHIQGDDVLEAAEQARQVGTDLIVTCGGGSVTGVGKMLQLCLKHDVRDIDHLQRFSVKVKADGTRSTPQFDGPTVRQIAIPTTLSGGEFNATGGYTDTRLKRKFSCPHPLHIPRVVILDPAATVHTPPWAWLSTGLRAVDHATEGLCSPVSNPVSDAQFTQALKLLSTGLKRTHAQPDDLQARLDCQLAVWLSVAGRQGGVEMGASHAIGHVLGGACDVPHGYTSCVMLPAVLRYNREVNRERQLLVAEAMGHPGEDAAEVMQAFIRGLGLPTRLSEVGVTREHYAQIAEKSLHDAWLHSNPRRITTAGQVLEILELAA